MIPFTMKILSYQSGAYTVEYIPEDTICKPIRLNVQLDHAALQDREKVIERLKLSSPQEYWHEQMLASGLTDIDSIAAELINTQHAVGELANTRLPEPVNTFRFHPPVSPLRGPDLDRVPAPTPRQEQEIQSIQGSSTPEQIAGREEQNVIKLKILIQQVIQEMAEGTV